MYYFFQDLGEIKINIGKISKRPTSIAKLITNVESGENMEKFAVGPTASKPGPILLSVAAIAVKFVVKSKLSKLMISIQDINKKMYAAI